MPDQQDTDERIIIRPAAVAKMLDVSRPYVYKLAAAGLLPAVSWKLNGSNILRFHRDDVAAFIKEHRS